jgi:hypothetical protein
MKQLMIAFLTVVFIFLTNDFANEVKAADICK